MSPTPTEQLSTQTVALSSEVVNLGKAGPDGWWADHHLATVRLSARGPSRAGRPPARRLHPVAQLQLGQHPRGRQEGDRPEVAV